VADSVIENPEFWVGLPTAFDGVSITFVDAKGCQIHIITSGFGALAAAELLREYGMKHIVRQTEAVKRHQGNVVALKRAIPVRLDS
jgi:hypothetical protein